MKKLKEKLLKKEVCYSLLVDGHVVVQTASKEFLIEQYEFQRTCMNVSVDRIVMYRDMHSFSEFKFNLNI